MNIKNDVNVQQNEQKTMIKSEPSSALVPMCDKVRERIRNAIAIERKTCTNVVCDTDYG